MNNIVVMASGAGTTFDNLARLSNKGVVNFGITALLTNNVAAGCVEVAIDHDIQTIIVTADNCWGLIPENTDLVILAGWLKLLIIPFEWGGRVLNIHPSLLPKYGGKGFYGMKVHQAVVDAGDKETGCTVHIVDNAYDTGEIIAQKKIVLGWFDSPLSVQTRVQTLEKEMYPKVIDSYLEKLKENSK